MMGYFDDFSFDMGDMESSDSWWVDSSDNSWMVDSLFELDGTTNNNSDFWGSVISVGGSVLKAANTPLGTGIIGGLASGYQTDAQNKILQSAQNTTQARIDKHNQTINAGPPADMAKRLKVNR